MAIRRQRKALDAVEEDVLTKKTSIMLRDPYYGIYSEKLLGHRLRCTQEDCTGWMHSNGFLRFQYDMPPEHGWVIEYECAECDTLAPMREREKLPLVREILGPLVEG